MVLRMRSKVLRIRPKCYVSKLRRFICLGISDLFAFCFGGGHSTRPPVPSVADPSQVLRIRPECRGSVQSVADPSPVFYMIRDFMFLTPGRFFLEEPWEGWRDPLGDLGVAPFL